jgi:oligogalacturonide lyase
LQRYADPATELQVVRLTDPAFASGLTAPYLHQFTKRSDSLLHWSERAGTRQAFLLDLKLGGSRQLTDAAALDVTSLTLSPDERSAYYFDGAVLNEVSLSGSHTRALYRIQEGTARRGMTVGADGSIFFAEVTEGASRIMRIAKQKAAPILEDTGIDLVMVRPKQAQLAYRTSAGMWLANLDGSGKRPLRFEPGHTDEVVWTPSGRSLIYLHVPDDPKQLIALREHIPDENSDTEIARTSQFATVSANGDASVFTGASRGKASAYVLILLRVTRRELTLCEHRASDARMVSPVFPHDSQSVYFVSDRHGKPAVYRVQVEKFVEATAEEHP